MDNLRDGRTPFTPISDRDCDTDPDTDSDPEQDRISPARFPPDATDRAFQGRTAKGRGFEGQ
jgi:hypothetical protein